MNQRQHEPPSVDADAAPAQQPESSQDALDRRQADYRHAQPFLTPAMQAFAEHWAHSRNQIKAYQHAYPGASHNAAKQTAGHLFRDPRVQAEIRRVLERWTDHSAIELGRIEHQLARVAFADPRLLYDACGNLLKPHEWDTDTAAAVASYSETPTKDGVVRKVRLRDSHAALRTLAEMKGAFEKNKAPPGAAAIFNINLGGGPMQLGAPIDDGRTITEDVVKPGKLTKARQLPKPGKAKAATRPIAKAKVKALI